MDWMQFLSPGIMAPAGLLAVTVLMVLTGKLVPIHRIRRMESENDHLRETVTTLTESVRLYARAAEIQTQTAAITETVMKALQQQAKESSHEVE